MFLCPVLLLLLPPETILSGLNQTGYPGEVSTTPKCRSRGLSLPEEEFRLHTCALCYHFMHPTSFQPTTRWTKVDGDIMRLKFGNATVLADVSDDDSPLLQSFAHPEAEANWRACCLEADRCCQNMTANNKTTDPGWCPRTWDGWLCWQDSPPHTTQRRPCPPFIHFGTAKHDCPLKAEKHCVAGWWGGHPENSSIEWTDYTTCSIVKDLKRRMHIGMAALSVSIAALLPALLIFNVYRQLNGVRISLHRNLFTSLLLNALCDIWFKVYILNSKSGVASPIRENDALCKVVLLLTKYFRLSNYLWMFCEGLYLHRVISSSFAQNERLVVFYSIGWGLPLAFVLLYALFRALFSDTDCWAFPTSYSEWILYVPCLFSLLVNTIFLVNIIRVLMSKLRASHSQESSQYRKAVRATLVLVPLFGLHFVVTIYRPANGICRWEEYYVYLDCLLDGLQGAFVAIIFCYWNGEIRSLLRRSYQNFVDRKSPRRRNGTITKYLSSSAATSTHEKSPQMQLEIVRLQT